MSGQYRSHFKGHGVQFSEHRQYVAGDDVRHIDWKVSARTREPLIKKYEEERELGVLLLVDVSASKGFGSKQKLKSEVTAEVASILAYAATHTGDKVGVVFFSSIIEKTIRPNKGRSHVLRIVRDVLAFKPKEKGTNLNVALDAAQRVLKHRGVVFVLSDFCAPSYDLKLKRLAKKHDVVAIQIQDPRERDFPEKVKSAQLLMLDPETGIEVLVDTTFESFRKRLADAWTEVDTDFGTALKGGKVESLRVSTHEDYLALLVKFFRMRGRKRGTRS